jgi:diguanylate cyclase (GGDEF)-like protein
VLAIPLIHKSEVMGVLYLDSHQIGEPLRQDQLDLLVAFGAQAAVSLENARLYELATLDPLTRLYHRRHFEQRLNEEFRRASRRGRPLSLLFMDIDRFKSVNDTHGHLAGDHVLRDVAAVLPGLARVSDISARYGGEEFVLLTPETTLEEAVSLGERIREMVRLLSFEDEGERFTVTVSVGIAALESSMDRPEALVEAADRAMYRAKALGGNRVCCTQ